LRLLARAMLAGIFIVEGVGKIGHRADAMPPSVEAEGEP